MFTYVEMFTDFWMIFYRDDQNTVDDYLRLPPTTWRVLLQCDFDKKTMTWMQENDAGDGSDEKEVGDDGDSNKKEDYCDYNNHLCPLFHLLHHDAFHPGIGHQLGPFSRLRVEHE